MVCEPADPLLAPFCNLGNLVKYVTSQVAVRESADSHTSAYEGDEKRYSALTCSKCRAEIVMAAMWDARTATRLENSE